MLLVLNGGGATATSSSGADLEEVTVKAGQTLWSIAEDIAPAADPRDVISDILSVNQLESGSVQAGQRLMLPAGYDAD
jgi:LysM repeat protein